MRLVLRLVFASKSAMPEWLDVLILAIIEGITEFLPISSTGHMLLAENWLTHKQPQVFLAVVQTGAVLAVIMVFTERVKQMLFNWREPANQQYILKLIGAFAVTAAGGLILKKLHFKLPESPVPVALATLIGGLIILGIEWTVKGRNMRDSVPWSVALAVGAGQLLAVIFPGLSRSGTAIMIGLALGIARQPATEFSFLLGIPTLLAAGAVEALGAIRHPERSGPVNWELVALGTIVAAITAFVTVKWLLRFIQSHTFNGFGWYRIIMGAAILIALAAGWNPPMASEGIGVTNAVTKAVPVKP